MAANNVARNKTTNDGHLRAIIYPTTTGTSKSQGEIRNVLLSPSAKSLTFPIAATFIDKPAIKKMSSVKVNAGTVVNNIYLICVKRGVPETLEASTVVSDKGDNLSPKYAPLIMEPAIHPSSKPCALPIPIKATPIVATVVQEEPINKLIRAHNTQLLTRNHCG